MKCGFGWAGVRYVITKFSRMDSLPNFLTHGAPLRARELRYCFPENYQPAKYISTHLKLVYGINVLGTALKKAAFKASKTTYNLSAAYFRIDVHI